MATLTIGLSSNAADKIRKDLDMERLAQVVKRKKSAEEMKAKNIMLAEKKGTGKQEVSEDFSFFF